MDIRKVKKLIELIDETGVTEIEIHEGEESVRISRGSPVAHHVVTTPPQHQHQPAQEPPKEPQNVPQGHVVKSPMVGTVYLAATPGEKPFVEVGDRVSTGDTLCLIEAMKMFNQIEADKDGVISARMIDNEQPVEFDQPLFIIE